MPNQTDTLVELARQKAFMEVLYKIETLDVNLEELHKRLVEWLRDRAKV